MFFFWFSMIESTVAWDFLLFRYVYLIDCDLGFFRINIYSYH